MSPRGGVDPRFLTDEQERDLRAAPRILTPSAIDPWFGDWSAGGRFTRQQLHALAHAGVDASTAPTIDVVVAVRGRDMWWPLGQRAPLRRIPCPIVGRRLDRLRVIAPRGVAKLVYPGGTLTRPR